VDGAQRTQCDPVGSPALAYTIIALLVFGESAFFAGFVIPRRRRPSRDGPLPDVAVMVPTTAVELLQAESIRDNCHANRLAGLTA
jgi:hypothetical protein